MGEDNNGHAPTVDKSYVAQVLTAEIDRLQKLRDEIDEDLLRHRAALAALTTPVPMRTRARASYEVRQHVLGIVLGQGPISTREVVAQIATDPEFKDVGYSTVGAALTWLRRTNQIQTRERKRSGQIWSAP